MDVTWTTEEVIDFLRNEHTELVRSLREDDLPLSHEEKLAMYEVINSIFTMLGNTFSIASATKLLHRATTRE